MRVGDDREGGWGMIGRGKGSESDTRPWLGAPLALIFLSVELSRSLPTILPRRCLSILLPHRGLPFLLPHRRLSFLLPYYLSPSYSCISSLLALQFVLPAQQVSRPHSTSSRLACSFALLPLAHQILLPHHYCLSIDLSVFHLVFHPLN